MATLTGFKEDRVGVYIDKDPYAILDYSLDWTNWMPSGDVIDSITVTAETITGDASALAVDSSSATDYVVTAVISAGTAGNIYNVEYRIITDNGKRDSRNIRIRVVERQA
tara:strand:- start:452 stop:781 length:330 start_codon:yes stop_codon:yes gene_type:complete